MPINTNTFLIWGGIILIVIIIIYIISTINSGINVDGFWTGNDKFLETADIFYLGADFVNGKLSLIIKPLDPKTVNNDPANSITQTYTYVIDEDIIHITNETSDTGKPILPDGKLTIKQNGKELAIVDDETNYLILTKFDEDVESDN